MLKLKKTGYYKRIEVLKKRWDGKLCEACEKHLVEKGRRKYCSQKCADAAHKLRNRGKRKWR